MRLRLEDPAPRATQLNKRITRQTQGSVVTAGLELCHLKRSGLAPETTGLPEEKRKSPLLRKNRWRGGSRTPPAATPPGTFPPTALWH